MGEHPALSFFQSLYQHCDEGQINLRFLPSGKNLFIPLEQVDTIPAILEKHKDQNCYFGVALRSDGDGTKNGIISIPAVWIDVDQITDEGRKRANEFIFLPSVTIQTSPGKLQALWLLREPVDKKEIPQVENILRRLAHYFHGDPGATDASRILRVPGTSNLKYTPPAPVKLEKINPELEYDLSDLADFLPEAPQEEKINPPDWQGGLLPGVKEGERNNAAAKLAGRYLSKGLNPQECLDLLKGWNERNIPPLPDDELRAVVESVAKTDVRNHPKEADAVTHDGVENKDTSKILIVGKFTPRPYTKRLLDKFTLKSDRFGRFWRYDPETGLWSEDAELLIEEDLRKNLLGEEALKCFYIKEVTADTKSLCLDLSETLEPHWKFIAFKNGVFNLETGEFSPFSPEQFFTSKLAVDYIPKSECHMIERIFKEIVPPERVIDLYELIAYCMVRTHVIHKIFFLHGSGGNGKGTYAAIMKRILGKANISSVSLTDFQTNRFASSDLFGRFANISGEVRYEDLTKTDTLKKLTGGDLLRAERKWRESFIFSNTCKLIFLTNELPRTTDKTPAFYRRVHLIHFPHVFEGEKEDKTILEKIPPGEYAGLTAQCLDVLRLIIERGWRFENEGTIEGTAELYERLTDPLGTFLSEFTVEDPDGSIPKWEFKEMFFGWLKQKGYRAWWTEKQLGYAMKEEKHYQDKRVKVGDTRYRHWCGISWKDSKQAVGTAAEAISGQDGQDGQGVLISS